MKKTLRCGNSAQLLTLLGHSSAAHHRGVNKQLLALEVDNCTLMEKSLNSTNSPVAQSRLPPPCRSQSRGVSHHAHERGAACTSSGSWGAVSSQHYGVHTKRDPRPVAVIPRQPGTAAPRTEVSWTPPWLCHSWRRQGDRWMQVLRGGWHSTHL